MLMASFCSEEAYSWGGASSGLESREDEGSYHFLRGRIPITVEGNWLPGLRPRLPTVSAPSLPGLQAKSTLFFSKRATWLQAKITLFFSTKATWSSGRDYILISTKATWSSGRDYGLSSNRSHMLPSTKLYSSTS